MIPNISFFSIIHVFGPPRSGWDLWFRLRPYVRSFVRTVEISESVHRIVLIFGTKLGLNNATEVTVSDFSKKKSRLAVFGPF